LKSYVNELFISMTTEENRMESHYLLQLKQLRNKLILSLRWSNTPRQLYPITRQ